MASKTQKDRGVPVPFLPDQFFRFADDIAKRAATPFLPETHDAYPTPNKPLLVVQNGFQVVDLEQYLGAPRRIIEAFNALDLESFCAYVNRHKRQDQSVIFINTDPDKPQVAAILDYHSDDNDPSWCSHKVVYAFPQTNEWKEWKANDKNQKDQTEMGFFIEDHMDQISMPPANVLLETVIAMKEVRTVTFGSVVQLQNGMVEFQYLEQGADGGKGKFMLPKEIELAIAPFKDGPSYGMKARMRYRCKETLTLWYELVRPDLVIEVAIKGVRANVEDVTSLPIYAAQRT